VESAILKTKML